MDQSLAKDTKPTWEVTKREEDHAKKLLGAIDARLKSDEYTAHHADIKKNRKYVNGKQHDDGEDGLVRANLIQPEIESTVSSIYAKNPEVSITPSRAVSESRYEMYKKFGQALEMVLDYQYAPAQANLKARAKGTVRGALTAALGWVKVYYQKDLETDPIASERENDTQDDIQRIRFLISAIEKGEGSEEVNAYQAELDELNASVEESGEAVRAEGLVIERVKSECIVVSGEIDDTDMIPQSEWQAQLIPMTEEKFVERFKFLPGKCSRFNSAGEKKESFKDTEEKTLKVWEVWHRTDMRIYTLLEGYDGYVRQPYTPKVIGERWYGFFHLHFDPVDGQLIPLAKVTMLRELQDEHNTTRTNFREHREKNVPFNVAHGGELGKNDTENLTNPGFMETVLLKSLPQGVKLSDVFYSVNNPQIDPQSYTTDHIRTDWELITRRGDSSRSMVSKPKTAAEAEIMQANMNLGTNDMTDTVEEFLRDISQYSAELCLQEMSVEQVQRIVGADEEVIEQIWPKLSKDEAFDLVQLEIRAGSTGKPDRAADQKRWIDMLPELRETMTKIIELREANNDDLADMMTMLLKETLQRFDERIDLDTFLPRKQEGEESPEEMQAKLAEQKQAQEQYALQLKDMLSTIANRDADTLNKLADAESKEAGAQIDIYMGLLDTLMQSQSQTIQ